MQIYYFFNYPHILSCKVYILIGLPTYNLIGLFRNFLFPAPKWVSPVRPCGRLRVCVSVPAGGGGLP